MVLSHYPTLGKLSNAEWSWTTKPSNTAFQESLWKVWMQSGSQFIQSQSIKGCILATVIKCEILGVDSFHHFFPTVLTKPLVLLNETSYKLRQQQEQKRKKRVVRMPVKVKFKENLKKIKCIWVMSKKCQINQSPPWHGGQWQIKLLKSLGFLSFQNGCNAYFWVRINVFKQVYIYQSSTL